MVRSSPLNQQMRSGGDRRVARWHVPDVIRWVIWYQVAFAVVATIAALADLGAVPHYLFPPERIFAFCGLLALLSPFVVLFLCGLRKLGFGQVVEVIASMGLFATTVFALLPLVQ